MKSHIQYLTLLIWFFIFLTGFSPSKYIDDRNLQVPVYINDYSNSQSEAFSVFNYNFDFESFYDSQSMLASNSQLMQSDRSGSDIDARVVFNYRPKLKLFLGLYSFGFQYDLMKNENSSLSMGFSSYKTTFESFGVAISYQQKFSEKWSYYFSFQDRRANRVFMRGITNDVTLPGNGIIVREEVNDLMAGIQFPKWQYSQNWCLLANYYAGYSWNKNRNLLNESFPSSYDHSNGSFQGFTFEFRQSNNKSSDELKLEN